MKNHSQLSKEERDLFAVRLAQGFSLRDIARELGRSHATLSRERRRNHSTGGSYLSQAAHEQARARLKTSHRKPILLQHDGALRKRVTRWLHLGWSPEIISGLLALDRRPAPDPDTIYRWIYAYAPHLTRHLVRRHPRRRPRFTKRFVNQIPGRVSVLERPLAALLRSEPGHWETDLVIGKGKAVLKVLVERYSRWVKIKKVPSKSAQASYLALARLLAKIPAHLRKTITYDNGTENILHAELNARFKGLKSYFCAPHHCWEKPTVENTNGLIRRFFPKRTNFDIIPNKDIRRVERWLNKRPRKCLHFKSSADVLAPFWCTSK